MKKIILSIVLGYCSLSLIGQNPYSGILSDIEQNNTLLKAMRSEADAEKIGNKTGLLPESPEVEFHYLWGSGDEGGTRKDITATQSFDFPTAYYHKKKVSDRQNEQVDLNYRVERKDIMLEAYKLCVELAYQSRLADLYTRQFDSADQAAKAYQSSYEKGEANLIEVNKANLSLIAAEKNRSRARMERDFAYAELVRLNGGRDFQPSDEYPVMAVPRDFDTWYNQAKAANLSLQYFDQEAGLNKSTEQLQRAMNLPKFSAGYMSEKGPSEKYQGVVVGMSVPLWENKNTVRQIKARRQAIVASQANEELRFRNESRAQFDKLTYLKAIDERYDASPSSVKTLELLAKARAGGEISLIDYLQEVEVVFEYLSSKLENERDLYLAWGDLIQWEL